MSNESASIQTFSGGFLDVCNPRFGNIDIKDIAHALSLNCRFNGHCRVHYSVAEHSVRVARILPSELQLFGLLHDASEAYIADVSSPVKALEALAGYRRIELDLQAMIFQKFGVQYRKDMDAELRKADMTMLATEARDLMGVDANKAKTTYWAKHLAGVDPLPEKIQPWTNARAEFMFLSAFHAFADHTELDQRNFNSSDKDWKWSQMSEKERLHERVALYSQFLG